MDFGKLPVNIEKYVKPLLFIIWENAWCSLKCQVCLSFYDLFVGTKILRVNMHCVKSVRIRSLAGPFSVRMREGTDRKKNTDTFHGLRVINRLYITIFTRALV